MSLNHWLIPSPGKVSARLVSSAASTTDGRSAGANLVTIFVGRHEIAKFVARLWAAARGRAAIRTHDSMVVIEHGDRRVAITLDHEGFGEDGPPQAVVRGMTCLLEALAELDEDRPVAIPRSRP